MAKITLAAPWTDAKGKDQAADKTVDTDPATARELVLKGLARPAGPVATAAQEGTPND